MKAFEKICMTAALAFLGTALAAEEFTEKAPALWETEYLNAVKEGRKLFNGQELGRKQFSCAKCHPDAADTHSETYPKFNKGMGKVVTIGEMINGCIANALEGERLAPESRKMTALISYITDVRRGVALDPGRH
jgi:cytochrome c